MTWSSRTAAFGLIFASCYPAAASPVHLACEGHVVREYPSEAPPEPEALSISIDEAVGTVTISSYGTATIKGEPDSANLRFVDQGGYAGELSGKINRFTGAVEFRWITSRKEPLLNYSGSCKPARPIF
jgi:hypothetical protein